MPGLQKLDLAQGTAVGHFIHLQKLAGVDHRFHHHILESGFLLQFDNLPAIGDGGGRGHSASDVFTGFRSFD